MGLINILASEKPLSALGSFGSGAIGTLAYTWGHSVVLAVIMSLITAAPIFGAVYYHGRSKPEIIAKEVTYKNG